MRKKQGNVLKSSKTMLDQKNYYLNLKKYFQHLLPQATSGLNLEIHNHNVHKIMYMFTLAIRQRNFESCYELQFKKILRFKSCSEDTFSSKIVLLNYRVG